MPEDRYKQILYSSHYGYVCYKIIKNINEIPIDVQIVDINSAFEIISNLKKEDIISKKISELNLMNKAELEKYLSFYTPNSEFERTQIFEYYSENIDKYLKVQIFAHGDDEYSSTVEDITTLKKTELELIEKKYFFDVLLQTIPIPVYFKNQDGVYAGFNKAFENYFGKSKEELINKSVYEVFPEELAKIYHKQDSVLLGEPQSQVYEAKLQVANGEIRDVIFHKATTVDSNGKINGLVGGIFDITQQKIIEQLLRDSEEKYRLILEHSSDLIWAINSDGIFTYISKSWERVTGYIPENLVNTPFVELIKQEDVPRCMEFLINALKGGEPNYFLEYQLRHADDTWHWHEATLSPVNDSEGNAHYVVGICRDVTERKNTRQALEEKTELLQLINDNIVDMVSLVDFEGKFTFVSESHHTLGYTPAELIGRNIFDYIHKDDFESIMAEYHKFKHVTKTTKVEFRFKHQLGHYLWLETKGELIHGDKSSSKNDRFIFCSRDVTERKKFDIELKQSQEKYFELYTLHRLMSDTMPDMMWAKDLNKEFIFANKAICKNLLSAKDTDEPIGKTDLFFAKRERDLHPENSQWHTFGELCMDSDAITLAEMKEMRFNEYGNIKGKFVFLDVHKAPLRDNFGDVIGVVGSARDITERVLADRELLLIQKRLYQTMKMSDLVYWDYDIQNDIFTFNDEFYNLYATNYISEKGYQMSSKDYIDRFVFKDDIMLVAKEIELANQSITEGINRLEHRIVRRDGVVRDIRVSFFTIFDEESKTYKRYGANQDITDLKLVQKTLHENVELLKMVNATKDKFFSILAHDLRSPISSFKEMCKMLSDDYNSFEEIERKSFIFAMKESSVRLYSLMDNLLEWSRSQQGIVSFNQVDFDLNTIIKDSINYVSEFAREKNIRIINSLNKELKAKIDVNMISTVIRNLISNAIKFTHKGGNVEIGIIESQSDNKIIIVFVKDSGIGISHIIQDKLFRIDENPSRLGTNKESGTGLGLIICQEFIEKHDGKIWVESEEAKGATFFFTVPKR